MHCSYCLEPSVPTPDPPNRHARSERLLFWRHKNAYGLHNHLCHTRRSNSRLHAPRRRSAIHFCEPTTRSIIRSCAARWRSGGRCALQGRLPFVTVRHAATLGLAPAHHEGALSFVSVRHAGALSFVSVCHAGTTRLAPVRHAGALDTRTFVPCGRSETLSYAPCTRSEARSCLPCRPSENRPCAPRKPYVICSSALRRRPETRLCAIRKCSHIILCMPCTRSVIRLVCAALAL